MEIGDEPKAFLGVITTNRKENSFTVCSHLLRTQSSAQPNIRVTATWALVRVRSVERILNADEPKGEDKREHGHP